MNYSITPVDMGICADCKNPWAMSSREYADFARLVKEKKYQWPKRCKSCRDKKRQSKPSTSVTLYTVSGQLKEILTRVINNDYANDSDTLAQDLADVTENVNTLIRIKYESKSPLGKIA